MTISLRLSIYLAAWLYGVPASDLDAIAWRESRYQCAVVRGSHVGCFQVSTRWSRYTAAQLHSPLIGALEAARMLRWGNVHCRNGNQFYRFGRCK